MGLTSNIKDKDWVSVRQGIAKLGSSKLGPTSVPTYANITLTDLTTNSLIYPNSNKLLTSLGAATNGQLPIGSTGAAPVIAALTGTTNQVTVTNGAGSITLSLPQDIHTGASPTFVTVDLTGITNGNVPYMSASGFADSPLSTDATDVVSTGVVQATDFAKTGWPVIPGVTLSFDNANRRLTVTDGGSAYYYIDGVKYTLGGNKTVDIDDTEGLWYIYFVGSTLTASQTPWVIIDEDKCFVAYVYWDATNNEEILLGYELHSFIMDGAAHERLHEGGGAAWVSGLLVSDTGSETVNVSAGEFYDEDISIAITDGAGSSLFEQVLSPAELPIYYRSGASDWRIYDTGDKANAVDAGYVDGSNNLHYNKLNGTWASTATGSAKHVAYFVVGSNDTTEPVALIMGQRIDTTLADAKENNVFSGLSLSGMPFQELVVLARLILKQSASGVYYTLEDIQDLRATNAEGNVTSPLITDHGGLGGLGDDDHQQYIKDVEFTQDSGVLVGTGSGTFAEETGATLRASIGLGTGDSPTFAGLSLSNMSNEEILFYDSTAVGGESSLVFDKTIPRLEVTGSIRSQGWTQNGTPLTGRIELWDLDNSHYSGFGAHDTTTESGVYKLPAADGTNGQVLQTDGSHNLSWSAATVPGGSDTHVQFNDGGSFGGSSDVKWDKTGKAFDVVGDIGIKNTYVLKFYQTGSSNYIGFKAPASIAASKEFVLPNADGSAGQALTTDGSLNLSWATVAGEKVKIDAAATADYIGAASSDGVLRTGTGLSYTDGGNYVTIAIAAHTHDTETLQIDGINSNGGAFPITTSGAITINSGLQQLSYDSSIAAGTVAIFQIGNASSVVDYGAIRAIGASAFRSQIQAINTTASSSTQGGGVVCYSDDGAAMADGDRLGYILFGGSRQAAGYANGAGLLAYADGNWSDGSSYPSMFKFEVVASGATSRTSRLTIKASGNIGFSEDDPVTKVEVTSAAPYLTLHNSTHEDGDYGRESQLIARGEQSGGEETVLGLLEFAHDSTSDDEKGIFTLKLNSGSSGTTPVSRLTLDSTGYFGLGTTSPTTRFHLKGGSLAASQVQVTNTAASSTTAGGGAVFYSDDGAAMASGHRLGYNLFGGSSSASDVRNAAGIAAYATENWTDGSAYGAEFKFETVPNGATARTVKLTVGQDVVTLIDGSVMASSAAPTTDAMIANKKYVDDNVGVSSHAMLDGSVHTDSVADGVTRGSIIYGNATPKWDELVIGAADTFLGSDGTDLSYRTAAQVMASLSAEAAAAFDFNSQNLTSVGTIGCGVITQSGTTLANTYHAKTTVGIADDNLVEIDDADAADDDYAKFTANGLEGRSYAEVKSDLSLVDYVDRGNTSASDFDEGDTPTEGAWTDLDLGPGGLAIVPANTKAVCLFMRLKDNAAGWALFVRKNGSTSTSPGNVAGVVTQVANIPNYNNVVIGCDTDGIIEYYLPANMDEFDITVTGWFV